jgi:anti-sigma regulatory factor (Ser/Thr protein kinase)
MEVAALRVTEASEIAEARRIAVAAARAVGLDETEAGRAAIIVTELSTNLIKHGGGGELLVGRFQDEAGEGFQCIALDKGAGMADLDACLRDGFSTAGSAGAGLGAVRRLSHVFDVFSRPAHGTVVLSRLVPGRALPRTPRPEAEGVAPPHAAKHPAWGGVSLPVKGEQECGDHWAVIRHGEQITMLVADGLGHGPVAAAAARAAVGCFRERFDLNLEELMRRLHEALLATRGAAAALARIDLMEKQVDYVGVGNIAGTLFSSGAVRKMVSHNGTVGHNMRKVQQFRYPFQGTPLVLMHSDGLQTSWSLHRYPGLISRHPTLIAAALYRDFARGRDDVTVVAAGGG